MNTQKRSSKYLIITFGLFYKLCFVYSQEVVKKSFFISVIDQYNKPLSKSTVEIISTKGEKYQLLTDSLGKLVVDLYCDRKYILKATNKIYTIKKNKIELPCSDSTNKNIVFKLEEGIILTD